MPEILLKHIVTCSSEDRNYSASNLLKGEGTFKWRTANCGEKNATVVIQFEKASQIRGIDIGNEGSAFVEVLVAKSLSAEDSDFQVLLVSSAFMSPMDSHGNTNRNAVRMFGPDKLSKPASEEKWDRVKVVCFQPYNKATNYGLSFIKFHSIQSPSGQNEGGRKRLGAFFVQNEKQDGDDDAGGLRVGSMFASRAVEIRKNVTVAPTGAAAIRSASRMAEVASRSLHCGEDSAVLLESGRTYSDVISRTATHPSDMGLPAVSRSGPGGEYKQSAVGAEVGRSPRVAELLDRVKRKRDDVACSQHSPFHGLMRHVTFTLSGFQNPYRRQLRDKAVEMGATYKADWDRNCTHLICAFPNTPKFKQVLGKGQIVSKEWIVDSYCRQQCQSVSRYRMDRPMLSGDNSGDEETPVSKVSRTVVMTTQSPLGASAAGGNSTPAQSASEADYAVDKTRSQLNDVVDHGEDPKGLLLSSDDSADDVTLDQTLAEDPSADIYCRSTDEDEPETCVDRSTGQDLDFSDVIRGLPELPDFFSCKHFFLYGDMDENERRLLTRYIAAYDGVHEEYMNSRVMFVVTSCRWDANFEDGACPCLPLTTVCDSPEVTSTTNIRNVVKNQLGRYERHILKTRIVFPYSAKKCDLEIVGRTTLKHKDSVHLLSFVQALSENSDLIFVKPAWLYACHKLSKLMPYQPYLVAP